MNVRILQGDCRDVLKTLPECSVDSIVTDPPYELGFMGKGWDKTGVANDPETWRQCLRVLKPGGHLLAFSGTRTQHRMVCAIEDAGFEIRDMLAWIYGSGFPKSLDVSKALDAMAGAEREVIGPGTRHDSKRCSVAHGGTESLAGGVPDITAPATDAARQWSGWGTALKPALETVTFASKPYTEAQERNKILSNLIRLEARLWLLSPVSAAEKSSVSSQSEYDAACAIARWNADEITSTRAGLCAQMATSQFASATNTSLSIVSSWKRTLAGGWNDGNTSTIETRSSTTIDWRILRFALSRITPDTIIQACSLPGGFTANASIAESHFNASLSLLQSIRTLSATEHAISQAQHEHLGAGVKPNLEPITLARKPLIGTVASNVLAHGTGALNIDGCRVGDTVETWPATRSFRSGISGGYTDGIEKGVTQSTGAAPAGRWPANLLHDGSDEVVAMFPRDAGASAPVRGTEDSAASTGRVTGKRDRVPGAFHSDTGSAARFFWCPKTSAQDRHDGVEHPGPQFKMGRLPHDAEKVNAGRKGNHHPTVKPTELMRYLCRLVTPPGGIVLDPFMGSGSTLKAAELDGFSAIGIELSAEYIEIARRRIGSDAPLFASVEVS